MSVGEPPATTPWGVTSACVPPASSTNSSAEAAKISTSVAHPRPHAGMCVVYVPGVQRNQNMLDDLELE